MVPLLSSCNVNYPLGDLLAQMLPLYDGADTLLSFQLMGLKRRTNKSQPEFSRDMSRPLRKAVSRGLELQAESAGSLFLTIFACKLTDSSHFYLLWTLVETILVLTSLGDLLNYVILDRFGIPFKADWEFFFDVGRQDVRSLVALCWLYVVYTFSGMLDSFKEAMQPRLPMLVVRFHRRLLDARQLQEDDYVRYDLNLEPASPKSAEMNF